MSAPVIDTSRDHGLTMRFKAAASDIVANVVTTDGRWPMADEGQPTLLLGFNVGERGAPALGRVELRVTLSGDTTPEQFVEQLRAHGWVGNF